MATRANWRPVPSDPRSRLGWIARETPRWAVLVLKKALLGVAALAIYAAISGAVPAFLLAALAFAALIAVVPGPPKGPVVADPAPGALFSGVVEIRREGALLGDDRAAAMFVDGWLHVEGFRVAFALRGDDVAGVIEPGLATVVRLVDGTELRFRMAAVLQPDGRNDRRRKVDSFSFHRQLRRWREGMLADGDSVLPPDQPHPSAFARATTELTVATFGTFATLLVFVALGPAWGVASILLVPGPPLIETIQNVVRLRRTVRRA